VIAATNRADILDPALMRSGRLDRKIEFPHPSEEARARILQVSFSVLSLFDDSVYSDNAVCRILIKSFSLILDPLKEDECSSRCKF
jgi:26S proteasome regulatory subunit T5